MAITIYPNTPVNVAIVESTAERHHVWIDRDTIYLYTGSDCPQDVQQDRMIPLEKFRKGFTDTELASVAASNDPIVRTAILKITTRGDGMVPVTDEVRAVLDHMVSIGLLTAGRPQQLLS